MDVLGIETSCDDTAVALVQDGSTVLANLIASQEHIHGPLGGVYPELACRHHVDLLLPLVEKVIQGRKVDLLAVANGPGLVGALLVGVVAAQGLAYGWQKPLIGVNHVEAHLYSAMMDSPPSFPALGVVLSGGHTLLTKMEGICDYTLLGTTVDDAIGEAFDKVATLLGYPYPGGPHIETLARGGDPFRYPFRAGQVKGRPLDFSFSGLKTKVLYTLKERGGQELTDQEKKDIAASFQYGALSDVVEKALKGGATFPCQAIYCGGGVTQNQLLRHLFASSSYPVFYPKTGLCTDNGAMIAGLGYHLYQRRGASHNIHPFPRGPWKQAKGK